MTQKADYPNRRKHFRFPPELKTIAVIDIDGTHDQFSPDLAALVWSESYGGCGLVMIATDSLNVGDTCMIQIGKLSPLRAEVRWRVQLDHQIIKLGMMFQT